VTLDEIKQYKLEAKIEQLRRDGDALLAKKNAEIERLRESCIQIALDKDVIIERLRAALTHISEHGDMPPDQLAMVALRALEPKP
jgi:hypothetical protein